MKTEVFLSNASTPDIQVPTDPLELWPPDHKMRSFGISDFVLDVTDDQDTGLSIGDVVISQVTSDEPDNGADDGNTTGDIVISYACDQVDLRAERAGTGNGRVYTVELMVMDASGNVGSASVEVHVPLDRDVPAVADGPAQTVGGCSS